MTRFGVCVVFVVGLLSLFSCTRIEEPIVQVQDPDSTTASVMNGIPVVFISYEGELSRSSYVDAKVSLCYNGWNNQFGSISCKAGVKVHGNSTADRDKKPYKLNLEAKHDWFGFGTSRKWVLLANYFDASLLRNYAAFKIGQSLGLTDTPDCVFVDVVVNGLYRGNYLLCETPEIRSSRVEQCAYLLEVDRKYDEQDCVFHIPMIKSNDTDICYRIQEPDNPTEDQINYLHRFFLRYDSLIIEAASFHGEDAELSSTLRSELDAMVDFESFVGFWIVQELFRNPDSWYNTSVWMNVKFDEKLHMGPLWDFDLGAGNYSTIDVEGDLAYEFYKTEGFHVFTIPYVHYYLNLYWKDVQRYWKAHRFAVLESIALLDLADKDIYDSVNANFELWSSSDFVNAWCGYDHDANVEYLYSFLVSRYEWLNRVFLQTSLDL